MFPKSNCDLLYSWVQKASAYCVLTRKIKQIEVTLSKARLFHALAAFDIGALIKVEEKFLAVLKWRSQVLGDAMMAEDGWDPEDGELGDEMMQKIALKAKVHDRGRSRSGEGLWNVSVGQPWLGGSDAEPLSGDLAAAADLVRETLRLETMVWTSRGECPGWKSNLLEDMKDVMWLMLKGSFRTGWYGVHPSKCDSKKEVKPSPELKKNDTNEGKKANICRLADKVRERNAAVRSFQHETSYPKNNSDLLSIKLASQRNMAREAEENRQNAERTIDDGDDAAQKLAKTLEEEKSTLTKTEEDPDKKEEDEETDEGYSSSDDDDDDDQSPAQN